eukprot:TRINITY_DN2880_c0_g1_i1.p1 TRINITY_DN2880_c0_g1~~TRINITY_DN2880_c0_g1_i1.p1  ORF type:complete len:521 (-),score=101.55 TRINITY_DN2880_c0_g1_i1:14-1576(-)
MMKMKSPLVLFLSCVALFLVFANVAVDVVGECPRYPQPMPFNVSSSAIMQKAFLQLDKYLSGVVTNGSLPGLMVTVVYDQETVWRKGYGLVNPFDKSSSTLSPSNVVKIASITKTFTSLMTYQLRDNGKVSLDDPVSKYLPLFSVKETEPTSRPITLHQLASHTSGLPREVPCDWFLSCTEDQILRNLSTMYVIHPPNTRPHYSNLGIALLGRATEKVTGGTYENYVETNILPALGMKMSGYNYTILGNYMAVGVTELANGTTVPAPPETLGWEAPAGGLLASADDMAKYISFTFRFAEKPGPSQPIDGHTVLEWLSPAILTRDGLAAFGNPWEYSYDQNNTIYIRSKAGELTGFRSQVAIVPEIKLGIFISVTTDSLPNDPSSTAYTFPAMSSILIPALFDALEPLQPQNPLPPNWKAFIGLYKLSATVFNSGEFQVYLAKDSSYLMASYVFENEGFSHVNITKQIDPTTFLINLVDGLEDLSCRWLDDGEDQVKKITTDRMIYLINMTITFLSPFFFF